MGTHHIPVIRSLAQEGRGTAQHWQQVPTSDGAHLGDFDGGGHVVGCEVVGDDIEVIVDDVGVDGAREELRKPKHNKRERKTAKSGEDESRGQ